MSEPFDRPRLRLVEANAPLRGELARALAGAGFAVDTVAETPPPPAADMPSSHALHVIDLAAGGAGEWALDPSAAARCLFLARDGARARALESRCSHALDVLAKPFAIEALEARVVAKLAARGEAALHRLDPLLQTRDARLVRVFERAWRAARGDCPVTLEGELGTGRRALARAIHAASPRGIEPLFLLEAGELALLPEHLLEASIGERLALARRGTLVVVEPEAWPERYQRALTAALRRTDDDSIPRCLTLARVAPERGPDGAPLLAELAHRLGGITLALPPLRERVADHAALCQALARRVARELGMPTPALEPELVARLAAEGFPGNRLGLESRLRSALVAGGEGASLTPLIAGELAPSGAALGLPSPALDLRVLERDAIVRALAHARGNRTHASRALGISVRTLRNKLHEYDLR